MKVQQLAQVQISQNPSSGIKEGSVVNGRVLSSNGNGSFTVSLAGQKINVSSQASLIPGQIFQASLSIQDGKVFLKLIQTIPESKTSQFFPSDLESENKPQALVNYLASLGLPPDSSSMKLLQFLQDLGFKFDSAKMRKILSKNKDAADKNEKNQEELLMTEKGVEGNLSSVTAVLYNPDNSHNKNQNPQDEEKFSSDKVKEFFSSLNEAGDKHKSGILTLFNSLSEGDNHWVLLPFEWNFENSTGTIKLLLNKQAKNIKRLIIECYGNLKKHKFVINYLNNNISNIKFSREPQLPFEATQKLCESLNLIFQQRLGEKEVQAEYVPYENIEGFAPDNFPLTIVREQV